MGLSTWQGLGDPIYCILHFRTNLHRYCLAVIGICLMWEWRCKKAVYCNRGVITGQFWMLKKRFGGNAVIGENHDKALLGQANRLNYLANSLHKGIASMDKERHIGAQLQAQFFKRGQIQVQVPKLVQGQQTSGRIGRAAAHAGLGRDAFFNRDVGTRGAAGVLLQQSRSACDQVVGGQGDVEVLARNLTVGTFFKVQGVTPVDQHENGLQQMIAIVAATRDVQKQVEFGWSGNVVQRFHAVIIASA